MPLTAIALLPWFKGESVIESFNRQRPAADAPILAGTIVWGGRSLRAADRVNRAWRYGEQDGFPGFISWPKNGNAICPTRPAVSFPGKNSVPSGA
jgi:hypothetical protein